jgi:hypothetical protein
MYISRKLVCDGAPPATEVPWRARVKGTKGKRITVVAQSDYVARQLAAAQLQCEPGQVELRMVESRRESA